MGRRVGEFIVNVCAWIILVLLMVGFVLLCAAAKYGIEQIFK